MNASGIAITDLDIAILRSTPPAAGPELLSSIAIGERARTRDPLARLQRLARAGMVIFFSLGKAGRGWRRTEHGESVLALEGKLEAAGR